MTKLGRHDNGELEISDNFDSGENLELRINHDWEGLSAVLMSKQQAIKLRDHLNSLLPQYNGKSKSSGV